MFKSVLVLCVGNICRSPLAEYLLLEAAQKHGFELSVASAGLGALVGQPADPNAIEIAQQHGLDITPHRARQLEEELLKVHELVLVMESWQQKELESRYPFVRGRVHLLGKWNEQEIEDPYKKPIEAFEHAYLNIEKCIGLWCEKVWQK